MHGKSSSNAVPNLPLMCEVVAAWQKVDTQMHGWLKCPPTETVMDVTAGAQWTA